MLLQQVLDHFISELRDNETFCISPRDLTSEEKSKLLAATKQVKEAFELPHRDLRLGPHLTAPAQGCSEFGRSSAAFVPFHRRVRDVDDNAVQKFDSAIEALNAVIHRFRERCTYPAGLDSREITEFLADSAAAEAFRLAMRMAVTGKH